MNGFIMMNVRFFEVMDCSVMNGEFFESGRMMNCFFFKKSGILFLKRMICFFFMFIWLWYLVWMIIVYDFFLFIFLVIFLGILYLYLN